MSPAILNLNFKFVFRSVEKFASLRSICKVCGVWVMRQRDGIHKPSLTYNKTLKLIHEKKIQ